MKRIIIPVLLFLAVVFVSSCSSCSDNKKKTDTNPYLPEPELTTDAEDTLAINELIDHYMGLLAENKVDDAVNLLNRLKDGEVVPLDAKEANGFKSAFSKLHIYGVKKKGFLIRSARNNDITILLQIVPSGDLDKEIGVTTQHINPIFKEGKWYLTLLDPKAEGVYDVFDEANQASSNVEFIKQ